MRFMPFLSGSVILTVITWGYAALVDEPAVRNLRRADTVLLTWSSTVDPLKGECEATAKAITAVQLAIAGTCQLEGLGHTTMAAQETLTRTATGFEFMNLATYITTAGDTLRASAVGTATNSAAGLNLSGILTVTGGTGRFLKATGSATIRGDVRNDSTGAIIGRYRLDGEVRY